MGGRGVGASSRNPGASFAKPQSSPGHPTLILRLDDALAVALPRVPPSGRPEGNKAQMLRCFQFSRVWSDVSFVIELSLLMVCFYSCVFENDVFLIYKVAFR